MLGMDFTALYATLHSYVFDPARLPVAAAALLIVSFGGLAFGPAGGNATPLFWRAVSAVLGPLGGKLDKTQRASADLVTRGMIVTLLAMVAAFGIGAGLQILSVTYPNWLIVDIVALGMVLAVGSVWYALVRLYRALHSEGAVKGAFYTIARTTRSNLATSDEFTITRTGIAMGAKAFDKGVVAPILWYVIGGLPLAFLYAGLAAMAWRFGKEGFTKGFGAAALALERLMGFIPNLFAGWLIAMAGLLTPTAGMTRAVFGTFFTRKGRAAYNEGGAVMTAMAYALNVSLGGAGQDLDGSAIKRGWAGPEGATAKLEARHLNRAVYILIMAHLLFFVALLAAMVFEGRGGF